MILPIQHRQKRGLALFIFFSLQSLSILTSYAQSEQEQILKLRLGSNQALKAFDHEELLQFLTEDVQITTGNGTLIQGKSSLRAYLKKSVGSQVYFIRTSTEVEVNTQRGLAWETGTWKGYDLSKRQQAVVGGKYAAQWTKESGEWLIKSELFVMLD